MASASRGSKSAGSHGVGAAEAWLRVWQRAHEPPLFRAAVSSVPDVAQRVPRRIFQTVGSDAAAAAASNSSLVSAWWRLNPEYEYHLLEERDCSSFVRAAATAEQRRAYERLATGASRSDLFRSLVLLLLGGVYADVDVELRRPLRTVVPTGASLVVTPRLASELQIAAPQQRVVAAVVLEIQRAIEAQVRWWQAGALKRMCKDPRSCVVDLTGPTRYRTTICGVTRRMRCDVPASAKECHLTTTYPLIRSCAASSDPTIHVCRDEDLKLVSRGTRGHKRPQDQPSASHDSYRGWDCGVAFHRRSMHRTWCADPATPEKKRECSPVEQRAMSEHYSRSRTFFHLNTTSLH